MAYQIQVIIYTENAPEFIAEKIKPVLRSGLVGGAFGVELINGRTVCMFIRSAEKDMPDILDKTNGNASEFLLRHAAGDLIANELCCCEMSDCVKYEVSQLIHALKNGTYSLSGMEDMLCIAKNLTA